MPGSPQWNRLIVPPTRRRLCRRFLSADLPAVSERLAQFEIRYLSKNGNVRFKTKQIFVSPTLGQEHIGLVETADGVWDLYFFDRLLARLDERTWKLTVTSPHPLYQPLR